MILWYVCIRDSVAQLICYQYCLVDIHVCNLFHRTSHIVASHSGRPDSSCSGTHMCIRHLRVQYTVAWATVFRTSKSMDVWWDGIPLRWRNADFRVHTYWPGIFVRTGVCCHFRWSYVDTIDIDSYYYLHNQHMTHRSNRRSRYMSDYHILADKLQLGVCEEIEIIDKWWQKSLKRQERCCVCALTVLAFGTIPADSLLITNFGAYDWHTVQTA